MKRLILLILLFLPIAVSAQTDHMAPLIKKYSEYKNCTTVILSKEMLNHMNSNSGIKSMQAISAEDPTLLPALKADLESFLDYYEVVMDVNSDGTNTKIYRVERIYKSKKTGLQEAIDELIIVSISETEGVVIRLTGYNIALSDASLLIDI